MAKYKSLLLPHRWVSAGRVRKCYHSAKHELHKGDSVLEVKVGIGWQGYCRPCGEDMIRAAIEQLNRELSFARESCEVDPGARSHLRGGHDARLDPPRPPRA